MALAAEGMGSRMSKEGGVLYFLSRISGLPLKVTIFDREDFRIPASLPEGEKKLIFLNAEESILFFGNSIEDDLPL